MASRYFIVFTIWILTDIYIYQSVRVSTEGLRKRLQNTIRISYWLIDILILSLILYVFNSESSGINQQLLFGLLILSLAPKILMAPILLIEDITRILKVMYKYISGIINPEKESLSNLGRRKFVSQLAIGIGAIPFTGLFYGILKGKYNYKVHRITLTFKDLPDTFDGFTITQLSDIHAGSFDNTNEVKRGVALANEQKSDVIFFTGDLVNNKADEMNSWKDIFAKLHAPLGKYSVLGNHDYGDYVHWDNENDKKENFKTLKNVHEEIGFKLLCNENLFIEKNGEKIAIAGVENWGKGRFAKYGDLKKALHGTRSDDFTILLSHDPSHWEAEVLKQDKHVHLTMSGHTHGMQLGIEVPGFKWSPVKYLYPQWAGAYMKQDKYIYVNRGFGFIGYPGRLGINPEITVITLAKG